MKIAPVPFTLKNGKSACLSIPSLSDAPALIDYLLETARETEFVLRYPEEVQMTLDKEERFITGVTESDFDYFVETVTKVNDEYLTKKGIKQ